MDWAITGAIVGVAAIIASSVVAIFRGKTPSSVKVVQQSVDDFKGETNREINHLKEKVIKGCAERDQIVVDKLNKFDHRITKLETEMTSVDGIRQSIDKFEKKLENETNKLENKLEEVRNLLIEWLSKR